LIDRDSEADGFEFHHRMSSTGNRRGVAGPADAGLQS
jgi:hypothetical protein